MNSIVKIVTLALIFGLSMHGATAQRTNGANYNPNGIALVYVEGSDGIRGFFIGKFEVTQAQWEVVMGSNPSHFEGNNLPVEMVSWNDVQEFITKFNALTGRNYRLPTVKEWEYAARGGKISVGKRGYTYSGSNTADEVAWYT